MIMPKKKRITIIVSIISVIVLILGIVIAYAAIATDAFKSNEELFGKYLLKSVENVETFLNDDEDALENKKYQSEEKMKFNYVTDTGTTEENQSNSLNSATLKINSQVDKENKYDYKQISLDKNSKTLEKVDFIRDNDIYGVHIQGIKQYVCVKNEDLKQVLGDSEVLSNQKNLIKDKIPEIGISISDLKFTDEEKTQLANTYTKIISENTSKQNFSKQNGAMLTIDEKDVTANAYTLILTKEQYNDLKIKMLEQLEKDEIILSKIDKMQNQINEIYTIGDYKQQYINNIEEKIKQIKDTNIGQEEVKITVYVKNKKTVRILVDDKTTKTTIDFVDEDSRNKIETTITKYDTVENTTIINLSKQKQDNETKIELSLQRIKNDEIHEIELNCSQIHNDNEVKKEIKGSYNNGTNKLSFVYDNDIKEVNTIDKNSGYENNNIILNNLTLEKRKKIDSTLNKIITEKIDSIKKEIKSEDIKEAFSIFEEGEAMSLEDNGITEKEKDRFNSQFEFYQGDDIELSDIEELLSTLENNSSKSQIISEDKDDIKIRITVAKGKKDKDGIQKVRDLLSDKENKDKKYTIKINYSSEGIIDAIIITYTKE